MPPLLTYEKHQSEDMKVYGVYQGCIFEGGGVSEPLYFSKESANAAAEKEFEQKRNEYPKRKRHDIEKRYEWKQDGDRWTNSVDEIRVLEYEVV